jgi:hypothetical protein
MPRLQFRLRSLFILTAIVAVGCLVGPPIVREVRTRFWAAQIIELSNPSVKIVVDPSARSRDTVP